MSLREVSMMRGAQKLVTQCAGVACGEQVVIATDTEKTQVAKVIAQAAVAAGAETVLFIMIPRPAHGVEPPAPVAAGMRAADVVFQPTSRSIAHTNATRVAREQGARIITIVEYTPEMLMAGGLEVDFEAQRSVAVRLAELLTAANTARVWSPEGTDLTLSVAGRQGRALTGMAREKSGYASPPNIEASIAPVEGTASGTLVVNASVAGLGVVSTPIRITVREGRAGLIQGGADADRLRAVLEAAGDPLVYNVGELGIGLNPKARIQGSLLEDEGCLGAIHIALGSNANFGGTVKAARHIDNILTGATLELDGCVVVAAGELRLPT